MAAGDDGHRGEPSVAAVRPSRRPRRPTPGLRPTESHRTLAVPRLNAPSSTFSSRPPEGTMTDTTAAINATNLGCSITCRDLEPSIRFYRDAIGFAVAQTFENEGKVVAAVVAAGDCRIVPTRTMANSVGTGSRDRVYP